MKKKPHPSHRAWVFLSHSSEDLTQVRKVRNYLERRGASPLIFHLLALFEEDQFWPIIVKEIESRNFFLYCESEAAEASEWVSRERAVVAELSLHRSIRVGKVRVDQPKIDRIELDRFLVLTRVYPSFSRRDTDRIAPFLEALEFSGFKVSILSTLSFENDWREQMGQEILETSQNGFVVFFLSDHFQNSSWVNYELARARSLNARVVPVLLDADLGMPQVSFDQSRHISKPTQLVDCLLTWNAGQKRLQV